MNRPKFPECSGCIFYMKRHRNPICGECGGGEFFEERAKRTEMTDNQLMREYRKMNDE